SIAADRGRVELRGTIEELRSRHLANEHAIIAQARPQAVTDLQEIATGRQFAIDQGVKPVRAAALEVAGEEGMTAVDEGQHPEFLSGPLRGDRLHDVAPRRLDLEAVGDLGPS